MWDQLKTEIGKMITADIDKSFGEVDPRVWVRLLQNKKIRVFCRSAAKGKAASKSALAVAVWGASVYVEHHDKPSWQKRYERLLDYVWFQITLQYGIRQGFLTRETETVAGKTKNVVRTVGEMFDIEWHLPWMFTSDVDLEEIRQRWNASHSEEAFDSVKTMKQRCARALESQPKNYRNELLSRVVCPDEQTRRSAPTAEQKRRTAQLEISTIELIRWAAESRGLKFKWSVAATVFNEHKGTSYTGRQLCNRYYKLKAKAERERWDQESRPVFLEGAARQCRTQDDYLALLKNVSEGFRKAAQDKALAAS